MAAQSAGNGADDNFNPIIDARKQGNKHPENDKRDAAAEIVLDNAENTHGSNGETEGQANITGKDAFDQAELGSAHVRISRIRACGPYQKENEEAEETCQFQGIYPGFVVEVSVSVARVGVNRSGVAVGKLRNDTKDHVANTVKNTR